MLLGDSGLTAIILGTRETDFATDRNGSPTEIPEHHARLID